MKRSRINYINLLPLIALKYASLYVAPVSCGSLHWILERTIWKFCAEFLQPLFLVFLLDGRVNHRTCVSVGSVRLTFLPLIYVEKKKSKVVKGLTAVVLIKKKLYIYSVCFYHCLKYFVETWVSLSVIWRKCPGYGLWKGRFRPKGIPFLGFRNEKWHCFHYVKYTKGKRNLPLQLRTVKEP